MNVPEVGPCRKAWGGEMGALGMVMRLQGRAFLASLGALLPWGAWRAYPAAVCAFNARFAARRALRAALRSLRSWLHR